MICYSLLLCHIKNYLLEIGNTQQFLNKQKKQQTFNSNHDSRENLSMFIKNSKTKIFIDQYVAKVGKGIFSNLIEKKIYSYMLVRFMNFIYYDTTLVEY